MTAPLPTIIRGKQFRELTGIPDSTRVLIGKTQNHHASTLHSPKK